MEANHTPCNCYSDIDRMINEGLGGGFIIYEYDKKRLEPKVKEIDNMKERNEERGDNR